MKVLVVGGGGREHALCWKLKQSQRVDKLYCAPGNGGISRIATCVPIQAADIDEMVAFAKQEAFDLVVVAPEDPLALGLVDRLSDAGIRAYGPRAKAAIIEASKAYSKEMMRKHNIPTARYAIFSDKQKALAYLKTVDYPIVIKADGLSLGKGVIIAPSKQVATEAVVSMMEEKKFGNAGHTVVIEEYLTGPELTVLAFTDGETVLPMISSRDHKRAYDHDKGPNTGGMGAVTPGANLSEADQRYMMDKIFKPTIRALAKEGRPFVGTIYFGLMLTRDGPKVIEYNCRFGDPEAQAILPRMENDLLDIMEACMNGTLDQQKLVFKPGASCCVVVASGGYPQNYRKGYEIKGADTCGRLVFHAGTALANGRLVTAGGRVLAVYAEADQLDRAIQMAYDGVSKIYFTDMHYRTDIGQTTGGKS